MSREKPRHATFHMRLSQQEHEDLLFLAREFKKTKTAIVVEIITSIAARRRSHTNPGHNVPTTDHDESQHRETT